MISRRAALAAPFALASQRAAAQLLAGGRPMRWVVPFPPGGAADTIARLWAEAVTARTGQAIVVDNRGGANGILGVQAVVQGPPDGSVLGVLSVAFFNALPLMMERPPYDPARDLLPLIRLVTSTVVCCVTAERARERGWTDLRALIAAARQPGRGLIKGSAGNGSAGHLLISTIARRTGAAIEHVAYRGGALALQDLLGGRIDLVFDFMPALMPHIAAGRLLPLAVGSNARSPIMPEVPGLGEFADLGLGDLDMQSWNALTAPAGLPPALARSIADGVLRAADTPGLAGEAQGRRADPRHHLRPRRDGGAGRRRCPALAGNGRNQRSADRVIPDSFRMLIPL